MAFDSLSEKTAERISKPEKQGPPDGGGCEGRSEGGKDGPPGGGCEFPVVKQFVKAVQERAVGSDVMNGLNPGQMVIKIVNEEMVKMMAPRPRRFS